MTAEPRRMPLNQLYKELGINYIRYNAEIEEKSTGQKKLAGTRPAFIKIKSNQHIKKQMVVIFLY